MCENCKILSRVWAILQKNHIHILLMSGTLIFLQLLSDLHEIWLFLLYDQCINSSVIVRQHDQGASTVYTIVSIHSCQPQRNFVW